MSPKMPLHCSAGWELKHAYYYLRRRRRLCYHFGLFSCPLDNWKSCEQVLMKFLGGVGSKWLNFGDDPDHHPDPGVQSPKSGFTGLLKKYLVDSDQSCIANLHCKKHSAILLCWRSAEVCALWVLLVVIIFWKKQRCGKTTTQKVESLDSAGMKMMMMCM